MSRNEVTVNQEAVLRALWRAGGGCARCELPHLTVLQRTINTLRDRGLIETAYGGWAAEHYIELTTSGIRYVELNGLRARRAAGDGDAT
jgi:hypothetical protein